MILFYKKDRSTRHDKESKTAAHAHKCIGSEEIMHSQSHAYTGLQLTVVPTHFNADTHATQAEYRITSDPFQSQKKILSSLLPSPHL